MTINSNHGNTNSPRSALKNSTESINISVNNSIEQFGKTIETYPDLLTPKAYH